MNEAVFAPAPALSVIIPAYNASKTIAKTLLSLLDQTADADCYEIIVVDDGSNDDTLAVCTEFAQKHSNIHVIHQPNGGVSAARNRGLSLARGHWVSFVDSDDCVTKDYVQTLLTTAPDADYVIFDHIDGDSVSGKPWLKPWFGWEADISQVLLWICDNRLNTPWDKRFSLSVIRENGISFPEGIHMGEDLLFNFRYARKISSAFVSSRAVYRYVDNAQSLTHKKVGFNRLGEYESVYHAMMEETGEAPCRTATNLSYLRVIARYAGQLHRSGYSRQTIAGLLENSPMVKAALAEPTWDPKNILRKLLLRLRQYSLCARLFRG